ncbi:nuclear transport factor 2 family protein [Methylobacterium sp. J-072]|uniref:nuclear transport factor 2 family protein n=1 Tax=Methylobacterium sp. J-072 TaxID=2836651 RepID=UPI001FB8EAE0|nr:nuclear transport factor 2 family protein [Methylobacterium sp. J-072]MCJ2096716.1 nuclear transport factor 2 family protein [Methylobacterium sp. J-072]
MTKTPEADIRRIYERWHETVLNRDIDGLMALYAEDSILESPLVLAESGIDASGILTGKPAIRRFFAASLRKPGSALGRWYRTGTFFSDGRQLTWEYPRATPEGDQVDLVEVMDLAAGLIAHHRVYWGWVGFRALAPSLAASRL